MCNLCIATDIEAAEPRNHHSTCENYLGVWTRDCETFFLLGYPLLAIFSLSHLFPSSFSLGPPIPLPFEWRLTILNFDVRIAHSLRPGSSAIRKWIEIRRRYVNEYRSRSTYLISKLKIAWFYVAISCLYAARADIWADLAADRGWKEHRFSAITGFELRLCSFKYSRDEYFLIVDSVVPSNQYPRYLREFCNNIKSKSISYYYSRKWHIM